MKLPVADCQRFRRLLCALQDEIRAAVIAARARAGRTFARVAGVTAADTIYQVDRISEEAVLEWLEQHWPREWPLELVMEGLPTGRTTVPRGTPVEATRLVCIIDPIDGTRGLMYDKRSAWILAAVAPQRGAKTSLRDIVAAAMTEVPTSKQDRADQLSAVLGEGVKATRCDLRTGRQRALPVRLSRATQFDHGFVSFARFFVTGKVLTARIEEAFWRRLRGTSRDDGALVFEDQYISTGGQLAELLLGHDRMIADLRPLVHARLRRPTALACHPYDICTELILREAGGVVESPDGRRLDVPLDTETPVAWVAFANPRLARLARPALRAALRGELLKG
jgi:fructose-1,6-bisphosphatase/inositol monophosphatase family enzyme